MKPMHGGARNDIHDRNGEHDARDHSYIPDDGDRGRSYMTRCDNAFAGGSK